MELMDEAIGNSEEPLQHYEVTIDEIERQMNDMIAMINEEDLLKELKRTDKLREIKGSLHPENREIKYDSWYYQYADDKVEKFDHSDRHEGAVAGSLQTGRA